MIKMKIRNYQPTDKKNVISLWEEVFKPDKIHNDPKTSIEQKTKQNDKLFFVAVEDNKIVGTIISGYDGHRGWLYSLAVSPKHRNKGIGTSLVKKAIEELKKLGCLKVNLQINNDNKTVVDFYKKTGFIIEDRISMGKTIY